MRAAQDRGSLTFCDAAVRASEVMLGKPVETYYSPAAFGQGYLNHVEITTANFGSGEHQYAHANYDTASVECKTDSARGLCHSVHAANRDSRRPRWA